MINSHGTSILPNCHLFFRCAAAPKIPGVQFVHGVPVLYSHQVLSKGWNNARLLKELSRRRPRFQTLAELGGSEYACPGSLDVH